MTVRASLDLAEMLIEGLWCALGSRVQLVGPVDPSDPLMWLPQADLRSLRSHHLQEVVADNADPAGPGDADHA